MFEYDHSLLSMTQLHESGIRSTKELEEVIEGYSFADEFFIPEIGYSVMRFIGFTKASKPIKVACRYDREIDRVITFRAMIPQVEEIIDGFCKFC